MASLTDQLPTINSGKPVINPEAVQQAGPNPFAALANAGGDFISALNHRDAFAREQASSRAAAWRMGQEQDKNSAFAEIFDGLRQNPDASVIPPGLQGDINSLKRSQTAEDQGKQPAGSTQIRVGQIVDSVAARYPDQSLDIYKEMHALGFDHPMLREAKLTADIEEKQAKDFADLPGIYAKAAAERGLALPGMKPEEIVDAGQKALKSENDLKQATALQTAVIARKDQDQKQKEFDLKQADRAGGSAVIKLMQGRLGTVQQSIMSLYNSATGDPQRLQLLNETQQGLTPAVESMRLAAKQQLASSNMATPENLQLVDSTADMYLKAGQELFAGTNSPYSVTKRSYEMLQTSMNLKNEEALPVWYRLKGIFGVGGLESILGTLPALSPELRTSVQQEVAGFRTSSGHDADEHIATLGRILSGATGIHQLTEEQAKKVMPSIAIATAGNAKHVIQNNDESSIPTWANGYQQIITASSAYTPGAATDKENMTATAYLADHNSRVLINKMVSNPATKEQGVAMAAGSAASAEQLLLNLKHPGPAPYGSIEYKGGRFQPVFNNRLAALEANAKAGSVPAQKTLQEYKGTLTEKANRMNQLVDHIMVMQQYNDAAKGIKPIDLRNHFAQGTPLPQGEGEGPNATKLFRQELDRLQDTIKNLPSQIQTDPNLELSGSKVSATEASTFFRGKGWSDAATAGIVGNLMHESNLNTGAIGDEGQALSLAQWHPDRVKEAKKQGFDLSNYNDALKFVDWELNNTHSTAGDRLKTTANPEEAARIFADLFEKPKKDRAGNPLGWEARRKYAIQLFGK